MGLTRSQTPLKEGQRGLQRRCCGGRGSWLRHRVGTAVEEVVTETPRGKVSNGFGGAGGGNGAGANAGGRAANRLDGEAKGKAEGDKVLWIDEGGVL